MQTHGEESLFFTFSIDCSVRSLIYIDDFQFVPFITPKESATSNIIKKQWQDKLYAIVHGHLQIQMWSSGNLLGSLPCLFKKPFPLFDSGKLIWFGKIRLTLQSY